MMWWLIGLLGTLAGGYGLYTLWNALQRVTGATKQVMQRFFLAAAAYVTGMTITTVLGALHTPFTAAVWWSAAGFFLLAATAYLWSMHTLKQVGMRGEHQ